MSKDSVDAKTEPSEVLVRMAVAADAPAISAVLAVAFIEYRKLYTAEGFAATALTKDMVEQRMTEGPVWVALDNQIIVGTVAAVSKRRALHVRSMAIVPAARGKRIGELLLNHVEAFAAARGYERMTLSTTPFLAPAIRLYERFGFQRSDEGPADLFGTPLFSMTKELLS